MSAIDGIIYATKSDCYQEGERQDIKRIIVHSTGCNNPNLKRYVQPDDGKIGKNRYNNSWNEPDTDVCVHCAIGKDKDGNVKTYQVLPFYYRAWGVYQGVNGSWNNGSIQFEMLEDDLSDKDYCKKCFDKAVELCAYLCKEYNIPVSQIFSHNECGKMGYGSQHIDPDNWWGKHGYTMDKFRSAVKDFMTPKVLDKSGYKKGDATIGSLALKELLLYAKKVGLHSCGLDENEHVGDGTIRAINAMLKKWGYAQNGIAGKAFILKLANDIRKYARK